MEHVSKYIYLSNKSQYPADKSLSKYGGVRKIHLDILIRKTHVGSHKYVPLRTLGRMNHIHDIQFKSDLFKGQFFSRSTKCILKRIEVRSNGKKGFSCRSAPDQNECRSVLN